VLARLVHRPVVSTNISPPAFFRVIEEARPTLLIDEADRLLRGSQELRGILNSGYTRSTAYVMRTCPLRHPPATGRAPVPAATLPAPAAVSSALGPPASDLHPPSVGLVSFSAWCPKALAGIGRLPDTLADRCILIQMQRKTQQEQCDRLRDLRTTSLREQCLRFVHDHQSAIAAAQPLIPATLNDRAADIWEPLFVLADLVGGSWPDLAREAAIQLTAAAHEHAPIGFLLLDILILMLPLPEGRIFSRTLADGLNRLTDRPWRTRQKVSELWIAQQLRPYGIQPHTVRIGQTQAKGYVFQDFRDTFQRYIPRAEIDALKAQYCSQPRPASTPDTAEPSAPHPA